MWYTVKPNSVKINKDNYALSPYSYRFIDFKNTNFLTVWELLIDKIKWFEPWSDKYIEFWNNYFIRISELDNNNYLFDISNDTKRILPTDNKKIINKWDICYQTASNVWNVCIFEWENAYYNSHIYKLVFDESKKYYIFAILKNSFWKQQVDIWWSIKWVDNFSESYLLNTVIPLPTKNNNQNPQDIEKLVSIMVQNLIDKEEQIKIKNIRIDELIENELNNNQKDWVELSYKLPRISEILNEWRLDTWLYNYKYKQLFNKIFNYNNWYFLISQKELSWWNTPKVRIFDPSNKEYYWFTPTDIKRWVLWSKKFIKTEKYNLGKRKCLLFSNRSNCWEGILYDPEYYKWWHHNQWIYRKEFQESELIKNIYILCLFNSYYYQSLLKNITTWSTFPELRIEQFSKIPLPKFDESIQIEINKEYYNKVEFNNNLNFDNYLQKEKSRNQKLWIYQLNVELFCLREKLEIIIDKIIMDEYIEVDFSY